MKLNSYPLARELFNKALKIKQVSGKPIDAMHMQHIAFSHIIKTSAKPFALCIPPTLFIRKDFIQFDSTKLTSCVLFMTTYPDITNISHKIILWD